MVNFEDVAVFLLATTRPNGRPGSQQTYPTYYESRILPIRETWGAYFPHLYFVFGTNKFDYEFLTKRCHIVDHDIGNEGSGDMDEGAGISRNSARGGFETSDLISSSERDTLSPIPTNTTDKADTTSASSSHRRLLAREPQTSTKHSTEVYSCPVSKTEVEQQRRRRNEAFSEASDLRSLSSTPDTAAAAPPPPPPPPLPPSTTSGSFSSASKVASSSRSGRGETLHGAGTSDASDEPGGADPVFEWRALWVGNCTGEYFGIGPTCRCQEALRFFSRPPSAGNPWNRGTRGNPLYQQQQQQEPEWFVFIDDDMHFRPYSLVSLLHGVSASLHAGHGNLTRAMGFRQGQGQGQEQGQEQAQGHSIVLRSSGVSSMQEELLQSHTSYSPGGILPHSDGPIEGSSSSRSSERGEGAVALVPSRVYQGFKTSKAKVRRRAARDGEFLEEQHHCRNHSAFSYALAQPALINR